MARRRRWGRIETIFLPGDRPIYELSRIVLRDGRLNWQEKTVVDCVWTCCLYRRNYRRWYCRPDDLCVYCLEVERLTK
jgi:hypothetical protein